CTGLGMVYAEGKMRTPVFDGLELEVRKGETVAIVGASGAGKSTLLHLLGGLDTPTAGEGYVDGHWMSELSDTARGQWRNRAPGVTVRRRRGRWSAGRPRWGAPGRPATWAGAPSPRSSGGGRGCSGNAAHGVSWWPMSGVWGAGWTGSWGRNRAGCGGWGSAI